MKQLTQKEILDSYEISGTNFEKFLEVLETNEASTETLKIKGKDVELMYFGEKDGKKVLANVITNPLEQGYGQFLGGASIERIQELQIEEIRKEFYLNRIVVIYPSGERGIRYLCGVSDNLSACFGTFDIKGAWWKPMPYVAAAVLKEQLNGRDFVTIVTKKTDTGIRKVFAVRSDLMSHYPQPECFKMFNNDVCFDGKFERWFFNNNYSSASWIFPDKTSIIETLGKKQVFTPSLVGSTSDTGASALSMTLEMRSSGGYSVEIPNTTVLLKHTSPWTTGKRNKFVLACNELKDKFVLFEDRMKELEKVIVPHEDLQAVITNLFEDAKVEMSAENLKKLTDYFTTEFTSDITGKDVILTLLSLTCEDDDKPHFLNLSDLTRRTLIKTRMGNLAWKKIRGATRLYLPEASK